MSRSQRRFVTVGIAVPISYPDGLGLGRTNERTLAEDAVVRTVRVKSYLVKAKIVMKQPE